LIEHIGQLFGVVHSEHMLPGNIDGLRRLPTRLHLHLR